ncbi:MAG: GNAT family N-acetyltransferase, partial [Bacteroidia bacterium]
MIVLQTARLQLRQLTEADAEFMYVLMNTDGWKQFIGDRGIRNAEDALLYMHKAYLPSYTANGFGFYAVELLGGTEPVGLCGLIKRADLEDTDIGFAFLPEHAGKGYATESARAVLKFAKEELKLKNIVAITTPDNVLSLSVLRKIGLTAQKTIDYLGEELLL